MPTIGTLTAVVELKDTDFASGASKVEARADRMATQVTQALNKAEKGAGAAGRNTGKGFGDGIDAGGGDAEKKATTLGSRVGTALGKAGTAAAVAGGFALVSFFKGAIEEAREAEKVMASTAQGIKTMGAESWTSAAAVAALSESISNKIGVDDELIQQSANLLLTFGKVKNAVGENNNVFDRAVIAAQDLAAKGFGDADTAAKMLGKALQDPIKGMTALGRAGVTFTAEQKNMIEQMVKSGDVLGAQKLILAEVERQVGGTAEATATSADKMKVAWANLQESVGTALMPLIEQIAEIAAGVATWARENPGLVTTIGQVALAVVALSAAVKLLNLGADVVGWAKTIGGGILGIGKDADATVGKVGGFRGALGGLVGFLGGPFGLALLAAGLAVAVFATEHQKAAEKAALHEAGVRRLRDILDQSTGAVTAATAANQAKALSEEKLGETGKTVLAAVQAAGLSVKDYTDATLGNAGALDRVNAQLRSQATILIAGSGVFAEYGDAIREAGISTADLTELALGNQDAWTRLMPVLQRSGLLGRGLGDDLRSAVGPLADLAGNLGGYNDKLREAQDQIGLTQQAVQGFAATTKTALVDVGAAFAAIPDAKSVTVKAVTDEARKALEAMGFTIENMPDGTVKITATTDEAKAKLDVMMRDINGSEGTVTINGQTLPAQRALAIIEAAINAGEGTVTINGQSLPAEIARQLIKARIDGTIGTVGVTAKDAGAKAVLDQIARERTAVIRARYVGFVGPINPRLGGATGGSVSPRGIGMAAGGRPPGLPASDTVGPFWLTPGEFVIRRRIAQKVGGFLAALNAGNPAALAAATGRGAPTPVLASGPGPSLATTSQRGVEQRLDMLVDMLRRRGAGAQIVVEDHSGDPVATARRTKFALRMA